MAKVEYAFPVEKLHGKIAKSHKIGFAHRAASKLNYTQSYGVRTTKYSQAEIDHQTKFGAVAKAVNARLADPNQAPLDQMAFKAQSIPMLAFVKDGVFADVSVGLITADKLRKLVDTNK